MLETKKQAPLFLRIIHCVFFFTYTILAITISVFLGQLSVLPLKFFIPIVTVLTILDIVFAFFLFKKYTRIYTHIFCIIFEIIFSIAIGFAFFYFGSTVTFFDSIKSREYQIEEYHVLVSEDSLVKTLEDLEGHTVAIYDDYSESYKTALEELEQKVTIETVQYKNLGEAINAIVDRVIDAIFIKSAIADVASDVFSNFDVSKYSIIDTIELQIEVDAIENGDIDITKDSFVLLISGIDTRGDISTVARSDVNIVVSVNPRTHTILLTTVPRDYEVQLHGTTGLKDKLTHAGLYGINMSLQTIEELLSIKINYYIRANFDSTISFIDALGGVDVTPDTTFYKTSYFDNNTYNCYYEANVTMTLNGACALTYARERNVYGTGDLHRIQNQQDVLTAIINKLTGSKAILTNYTNILTSLSNTIETNVPSDQLYHLINIQLDEMPSWTLERNTINGTEIHVPTYTIPDQILFVFQQDPKSLAAASMKIQEVLEAN